MSSISSISNKRMFYLQILTYSEEHESLFSMTLDTSIQNYENEPSFTKTTWDCLRLSYNPPWPLHLLFTESVMEKYAFSFLTFLFSLLILNLSSTYIQDVDLHFDFFIQNMIEFLFFT